MSLTHPHIRSHRAMAKALRGEADHLRVEAPTDHSIGTRILCAIADAHEAAAADLEKQEQDLLDKLAL